jgi:hypothetical protein
MSLRSVLQKHHTSLNVFVANSTVEEAVDVFEIGMTMFVSISVFDCFGYSAGDEIEKFFVWFELGEDDVGIQDMDIEDMIEDGAFG